MLKFLGKAIWSFLKKLKLEHPHDPAIAFLGVCPREIQSGSLEIATSPFSFHILVCLLLL
jgi:hypothetical protein